MKDEGKLDLFDKVFNKVQGTVDRYGQNPVDIPEDWLKAVAEKFLTEEEMAEIEKPARGRDHGDAQEATRGAEGTS